MVHRHPRKVIGQGFAPRLALLPLRRLAGLELLELFLHRRQIRIQRLFQKARLVAVELLARAVESDSLVARQLVREVAAEI